MHQNIFVSRQRSTLTR